MKFSNFLFPESKIPTGDFDVIDESLREAELTESLGYDAIWLAEHHFDGGCAYVDPVTFASAVAARTSSLKIGFAVAQMALHHPVRFAEQIALIDNISRGRMIVGVGRGTAYNFYEFRGYGINPSDAQEMLLEVEEVLIRAWTSENFHHKGKYWNVELPLLRPQVYQKPHPPRHQVVDGIRSIEWAAQNGIKSIMWIPTVKALKVKFEAYKNARSESEKRNVSLGEGVTLVRDMFVADSMEEAKEKAGEHMVNYMK